MPGVRRHLKYARKHLTAADKIAGDEDTRSWAAVALFYAAHQVVHAVLARDGHLQAKYCVTPKILQAHQHPESHARVSDTEPGTNILIKKYFLAVEEPYMELFTVSRSVRYQGKHIGEALWDDLRRDFADVCTWAQPRLEADEVPDWMRG